MRRLRRHLSTLALLLWLLAAPASAYTVTGATPAEKDLIQQAFAAAAIDMVALDQHYRGIRVIVADEWPPYWNIAPGVEVISMDVLPAAIGLAYSDGTVVVKGSLPWALPSLATEVLTHEFSHLDWFRRGAPFWTEWNAFITEGVTITEQVWATNPAEAYAEHGRRFWWPAEFWVTERPRTNLRVLTEEEFLAWVEAHTTTTTVPPTTTSTTAPPPPPTTTTTLDRGDPFTDVARDDAELWEAAWWARDRYIFVGYGDGTLRPYDPLLRHHVALVVDRWSATALVGFFNDWAVASRGDVWTALPGLRWDSARMEEPLLRSQLLRLMWRAQNQ